MGYSTDHNLMYTQTVVFMLWLSAQLEKRINLWLNLIKNTFIGSDKSIIKSSLINKNIPLFLPVSKKVLKCNVRHKNWVISVTASFYLELKI